MSDLDEVARLLHSKTMEGKLKWRLEGDRRVTTKQGDSFLEVERFAASPPVIGITLRNSDGIQLAFERYQFGTQSYEDMQELMTRARRDTLGVDKAIGALKDSLLQL